MPCLHCHYSDKSTVHAHTWLEQPWLACPAPDCKLVFWCESQVERRILYVNVTATLGVELAPSATPDEVEAAMDLTSLSADDPIGLLSNDPDKFFGRTTKVCRPVYRMTQTVAVHCVNLYLVSSLASLLD